MDGSYGSGGIGIMAWADTPVTKRTQPAQRIDTIVAADNSTEEVTLDRFLADNEQKAFRSARYALWDDELALDVVQDAMMKLVEKYAGRPASEWPALFYTIVNNRIRDAQRRRMVRDKAGKVVSLFRVRQEDGSEADLLETELAGQDPTGDAEPERALRDKQLRSAIDQAVAGLSWRQRQVFLLREEQGLDVRQTAAVLGCSEGSVKQHHFRAMQALRRQLAEDWHNE